MKKFVAILMTLIVVGVSAFAEIDVDKYQEQINRCTEWTILAMDRRDAYVEFNDLQDNRFHLYGDPEGDVITWEWYVGEDGWESEPYLTMELSEETLWIYETAIINIFEDELL